jgi:hypothetical protein
MSEPTSTAWRVAQAGAAAVVVVVLGFLTQTILDVEASSRVVVDKLEATEAWQAGMETAMRVNQAENEQRMTDQNARIDRLYDILVSQPEGTP